MHYNLFTELKKIPRDFELIIIILIFIRQMIYKFNWPLINIDSNFNSIDFLSGEYCLNYEKSFKYEIKIFYESA